MNTRQIATKSLFALAALCACGPGSSSEPEADPGFETGACVESLCFGELICVDDQCVDPNAPPMTGGPTGGGSGDTAGVDESGDPVVHDSVSILIVMDNSGSMGEEQLAVTQALQGLPAGLDAAGVDWRLAVTTTDNGNQWCGGTSPEGGNFVATSCRSRLTDFTFQGASTIDAQESCVVPCPEGIESIEFEPTAVDGDATMAPRPWIQSVGGQTNLPGGLTPFDALGCIVPQGINGCGFESHLESMWKGIARTEEDFEDEFGFFPPGALPFVVIVTDEMDCSNNPDHATIFDPDGDRIFWADPDSIAPTSAVCWNAGVTCSGGECSTVDLDAQGNAVAPASAEEDAVIYPVSRYSAILGGLSNVQVMLIGGVTPDGTAVYEPALDPEFQNDFGIGPGCEGLSGPAVPPVRMRDLADEFADPGVQNKFSICEASHDPAVAALLSMITSQLP